MTKRDEWICWRWPRIGFFKKKCDINKLLLKREQRLAEGDGQFFRKLVLFCVSCVRCYVVCGFVCLFSQLCCASGALLWAATHLAFQVRVLILRRCSESNGAKAGHRIRRNGHLRPAICAMFWRFLKDTTPIFRGQSIGLRSLERVEKHIISTSTIFISWCIVNAVQHAKGNTSLTFLHHARINSVNLVHDTKAGTSVILVNVPHKCNLPVSYDFVTVFSVNIVCHHRCVVICKFASLCIQRSFLIIRLVVRLVSKHNYILFRNRNATSWSTLCNTVQYGFPKAWSWATSWLILEIRFCLIRGLWSGSRSGRFLI